MARQLPRYRAGRWLATACCSPLAHQVAAAPEIGGCSLFDTDHHLLDFSACRSLNPSDLALLRPGRHVAKHQGLDLGFGSEFKAQAAIDFHFYDHGFTWPLLKFLALRTTAASLVHLNLFPRTSPCLSYV